MIDAPVPLDALEGDRGRERERERRKERRSRKKSIRRAPDTRYDDQ